MGEKGAGEEVAEGGSTERMCWVSRWEERGWKERGLAGGQEADRACCNAKAKRCTLFGRCRGALEGL